MITSYEDKSCKFLFAEVCVSNWQTFAWICTKKQLWVWGRNLV